MLEIVVFVADIVTIIVIIFVLRITYYLITHSVCIKFLGYNLKVLNHCHVGNLPFKQYFI